MIFASKPGKISAGRHARLLLGVILLFILMLGACEGSSKNDDKQAITRHSSSLLSMALEDSYEKAQVSIYELPDERDAKAVLDGYDVVWIKTETLPALQDAAARLLDAGVILYYSNPELSNEELAARLSIPKNYISHVNRYERISTAIYKAGEMIVFANVYRSSDDDSTYPAEEAIIEDGLRSVLQGEQGAKAVDWEMNDFSGPYHEIEQSGYSLFMEQQLLNIYDKGTLTTAMRVEHVTKPQGLWQVNGVEQWVWDAAGYTAVRPSSKAAIDRFTIRMHANIPGHHILQYTSQSVDEWKSKYVTHGTETQTYLPTMGDNPNVRDWLVEGKQSVKGLDRRAGQAIRVASTGGQYAKGSFTKLIVPTKKKSWELEAGSWF